MVVLGVVIVAVALVAVAITGFRFNLRWVFLSALLNGRPAFFNAVHSKSIINLYIWGDSLIHDKKVN